MTRRSGLQRPRREPTVAIEGHQAYDPRKRQLRAIERDWRRKAGVKKLTMSCERDEICTENESFDVTLEKY